MTLNRAAAILAGFLVALSPASFAATSYKLPPRAVIDILDAPGAPLLRESPAGDAILLVEVEPNPPLSLVAEPFLRLGGVRLTPKRGTRQHLVYGTGLTLLTLREGGKRRVELPPRSRIGLPVFSPDGGTFAFMRDTEDRSELWIGETKTAKARPYADVRLDDVLGEARIFSGDGRSLLLLVAPPGRGPAPPEPAVPAGPVVEETIGKTAQVATYQDLLRNTRDEELFQYFGTSQIVRLDLATGKQTAVGTPGLHESVEPSPDGKFFLVTRLRKPFSYRVPYGAFPRTIEIWDAAGKPVRTVAELPLADQTPRQGVPSGARNVQWQPMEDATLFYVEALDGGDPLKKVPFRDSLKTSAAPFSNAHRHAPRNEDRAPEPLARGSRDEETDAPDRRQGSRAAARGRDQGDPEVRARGQRASLGDALSAPGVQARHAPAVLRVGLPPRIFGRGHRRAGAPLAELLHAPLGRVTPLLPDPGLGGAHGRHDARRGRSRAHERHLRGTDRRLGEGDDRRARRAWRRGPEARRRGRPQLRRLHDCESARAHGSLRGRDRAQRRLQPLADAVRIPVRTAQLLGGDGRVHEGVALHVREQDQDADPPHPWRGGQQLGHLPDPVRASLRRHPGHGRHGAARDAARRGARLSRARIGPPHARRDARVGREVDEGQGSGGGGRRGPLGGIGAERSRRRPPSGRGAASQPAPGASHMGNLGCRAGPGPKPAAY